MTKHVRFLLAAAIVVISGAAHAQSSSAHAEQLFRVGKAMMAQQAYAEACKKFEASDKLDPAVTTKMNLADCREKNGQGATAWGLYLDVVRIIRDDERQKALATFVEARAQALELRLSYLIIGVRAEAQIDGLVIMRNGLRVDPLTWNTSLPVDGGDYMIEAKAPRV